MTDQNILIISGVVLVFLLVILLVPWGGTCNCSESYSAPRNAQFTVNRPKYMVQPTHPVKSSVRRENWIIPTPTKEQTLKSDYLDGGFRNPLSNPQLGGLQGSAMYGVSTPGINSLSTVSGRGDNDPGSIDTWRTVI